MSISLISGCVLSAERSQQPHEFAKRYADWQKTLAPRQDELEPPIPAQNIPTPSRTKIITPEAENVEKIHIYLDPGLPVSIINSIDLTQMVTTTDEQIADFRIQVGSISPEDGYSIRNWVYTLVAPFYTVPDGLSISALTSFWRGESDAVRFFTQILLTAETHAAMLSLFGEPDDSIVEIVTKDELAERALSDQSFLSILPLEELNPHWKVLRIDEQSPMDDFFTPQAYPLTLKFWIEGNPGNLGYQELTLKQDNYDPDLRTVLIMTGVTALTRATAYRMEIQGNHFPGQDVHAWFVAADFVHISNEVPFANNCPIPDPIQTDLIFCSAPERIELLEYIETDIIELSGNHMLDYGIPAMNLTLEMYADRGWETYAGGWDISAAQSAAKLIHNGNKLAFLGCNPVGPPNAWAGDSRPGAAACGDYQWILDEIVTLRAQGYLPIVTLQYFEDYTAYPSPKMIADFQRLAEAGAVMVSGSQAHTPKAMVFHEGSFVHFGLGNLFFDQMEVYYGNTLMPGTREAFIDRLVFYNGRLISVELLTTMLEDYARPRPMTFDERETLLSRIFNIAVEYLEER